MTVKYHIDKQQGIVFTTLSHTLKFDECLSHHERLERDSDFNPSLKELIDGGAVKAISFNIGLVLKLTRSCPFHHQAKRAIYSSDKSLNYRFAYMFQTFAGKGHGEIKVFKDREEALKWLEVGQTSH